MKFNASTLRLTTFIATAYLLVGAVGLTLAIPPGYASPVFPAAGLALGSVLRFGRRALPGIWLGSLTMNLAQSVNLNGLTPAAMAVAAVIATGVTLQAWAGYLLVTRLLPGWKSLEREQDVLWFLFWGGAVACLLSPLFGVTGLYVVGIIARTELLFNYWNWYVGDTMGVLVFAPLTLCLLNREDTLWSERRRQIVLPLLVTLAMTLLAFYGAAHWERSEQQNRLQTDGDAMAKLISDRLITHREVLASLHHFIQAMPEFTFRQFEQFTGITLKDNHDIFALGFNDLVTLEQRPEYERKMSGLSPLGPFKITERDSLMRLVRAAPRPDYVAVRYIVPLADNQPAVGFDIHSEPIRRAAVNRARASNNMAVTAPIKLVQEKKERVGVLEIMPVEKIPTTNGKVKPRLLGFAVAVVKVDELIDIAIRDKVPAGLRIQVTDHRGAKDRDVLYSSSPREAAPPASSPMTTWNRELSMGDRNWELSVITTQLYLQQHRPWLAWGVGVAGLLFAALLQTLMLGMTGRTALIQRQNKALHQHREELILKDQALLQNEKMASIGQLAAGVAHEINNPLGFISSNLRTLAEYFDQMTRFDRFRRDLDESDSLSGNRAAVTARRVELEIDSILEDGADLIAESLGGARRVTKIVHDLKNFSRVDALEKEEITLDLCMESALNICNNELKYVAIIRKEYRSGRAHV